MKIRRSMLPVAVVALLASLPLHVQAAAVAVVTTPVASFTPGGPPPSPPLEISEGGTLLHANFDTQAVIASSWGWHAVVSDDTDETGTPLFASDLIGWGQVDTVDGVETLPPGAYPFHCQTHGDVMTGILVVTQE